MKNGNWSTVLAGEVLVSSWRREGEAMVGCVGEAGAKLVLLLATRVFTL